MKHNSKVSLIPCKKGVPNEVIYNYCMNPDPQKKLALKLPSSMQITSYLKKKKHKEEHARRPSKNNIDLLQELCDYRFGKLS